MSELAVRCIGLRKEFGPTVAVAGLDLEVEEGALFGLVGPDGAGKTTSIRMLCGVVPPSGGEATVGGIDAVHQSEKLKPHLGYMSQRFSLYGDLTVAENLSFFADLHTVPRRDRAKREAELMEFSRLGSFRRRLAQNLSGGMRQKLALACTLMHRPRYLFLDEPTTGVDPVSRRDFWRILYSLLGEGVTIFVSTPYMDEAERCSRVALMNRGRVVVCDTPDGLKRRMSGSLFELIAEPQRPAKAALAALEGVRSVEVFGERLHVWVAEAAANEEMLRSALKAAGASISLLRAVPPGLEDVFVSLVGETGGEGVARSG